MLNALFSEPDKGIVITNIGVIIASVMVVMISGVLVLVTSKVTNSEEHKHAERMTEEEHRHEERMAQLDQAHAKHMTALADQAAHADAELITKAIRDALTEVRNKTD